MPLITRTEVEELYRSCVYKIGNPTDPVPSALCAVEGIHGMVRFDADKIAENKKKIANLLEKLDYHFFTTRMGGGGSDTFLSMVVDYNGELWGDQGIANDLMVMGIAAGFVKLPVERSKWKYLAGRVPLVQIETCPPDSIYDIKDRQRAKPEQPQD